MTAARKYHVVEHCEICRRPFPASALTRGLCEACAARPKPRPPVDLYALDDGDAETQVDHVCKDCGAHFIAPRLTRLCPDCRARHNRETARRAKERKRALKGRSGPAERRCAKCGKPIDSARKYCLECAEARIVARKRAFADAHRDEINARQRANYAARKAAKTQGDNNNER